jgi:hypothetical protein
MADEESLGPTSVDIYPNLAEINRLTMSGEIKSVDEWIAELEAAGVPVTDETRAEIEKIVAQVKQQD